MTSGHHVQVAGSLVEGSSRYDEATKTLRFAMADENGHQLQVEYDGVKPGNFEDATQVVAVGVYRDGVFRADQLLVKCPSKYQGIEKPGDAQRS
ncbi:MAG TPA: cytochrome c maturation protein CcmE [Acidobacteria bacterium]|nr:cytochrome c maturation protein CcmE [Acidobacteriota bacterium]